MMERNLREECAEVCAAERCIFLLLSGQIKTIRHQDGGRVFILAWARIRHDGWIFDAYRGTTRAGLRTRTLWYVGVEQSEV